MQLTRAGRACKDPQEAYDKRLAVQSAMRAVWFTESTDGYLAPPARQGNFTRDNSLHCLEQAVRASTRGELPTEPSEIDRLLAEVLPNRVQQTHDAEMPSRLAGVRAPGYVCAEHFRSYVSAKDRPQGGMHPPMLGAFGVPNEIMCALSTALQAAHVPTLLPGYPPMVQAVQTYAPLTFRTSANATQADNDGRMSSQKAIIPVHAQDKNADLQWGRRDEIDFANSVCEDAHRRNYAFRIEAVATLSKCPPSEHDRDAGRFFSSVPKESSKRGGASAAEGEGEPVREEAVRRRHGGSAGTHRRCAMPISPAGRCSRARWRTLCFTWRATPRLRWLTERGAARR